jgi:hypothetical protein
VKRVPCASIGPPQTKKADAVTLSARGQVAVRRA